MGYNVNKLSVRSHEQVAIDFSSCLEYEDELDTDESSGKDWSELEEEAKRGAY